MIAFPFLRESCFKSPFHRAQVPRAGYFQINRGAGLNHEGQDSQENMKNKFSPFCAARLSPKHASNAPRA